MTDPEKRLQIRTSESDWLARLANAYKAESPAVLLDDASLGVNPEKETIFGMAIHAKTGIKQIYAVLSALGVGAIGAGMIIACFLDPEPTSKLAAVIATGAILVGTGGLSAIWIIADKKPPSVRLGSSGFEISWN